MSSELLSNVGAHKIQRGSLNSFSALMRELMSCRYCGKLFNRGFNLRSKKTRDGILSSTRSNIIVDRISDNSVDMKRKRHDT